MTTLAAGAATVLADGQQDDDARTGTEGDDDGNGTDTEGENSGNGTDTEGDNGEDGTDTESENGAALRVAHMSPNAPNVDVYVEDRKVVDDLAFRSVTDYLDLEPGTYQVTVTAAGAPEAVVFDESVTLESEDYTAVARGELNCDKTEFTVQVLEDQNGTVDDETARVRVFHAAPDAPAVDVTVNDGARTVFDGVERFTSGGYVEVPAGDYEVEVRPDTEDDDGSVVFETPLTLEGGTVYTVFAAGYLMPDDGAADEPFDLVTALDRAAPPRGDGDGTQSAIATRGN